MSLSDIASVYPYTLKEGRNNGSVELKGPCWHCGGKDRFQVFYGKDGKVHWRCRQAEMHNTHGIKPRWYYFGDYLYFALTGSHEFVSDPLYYVLTGHWRDGAEREFVRPKTPVKPEIVLPEPPRWAELEIPQPVTMTDVELYSKNIGPVLRYFGQYKLAERTLRKFKIGYSSHPPRCSLPGGFSIPNIAHGPDGKEALRAIQFRRDEEACIAVLKTYPPQEVDRLKSDLVDVWLEQIGNGTMNPEDLRIPTMKDLAEHKWDKYAYVAGVSRPGIWGDELVTLPGNERLGPKIPYIFMTEDYKSRMCLMQAGYPAVSYKERFDWDAWLPHVFSRVGSVYIIADRDEKENNRNAGLGLAHKLAAHIRAGEQSHVRVILPPGHHNDVADLVRADGYDAMQSWIASRVPGLAPLLDADQ
jgi:hypothetical protein